MSQILIGDNTVKLIRQTVEKEIPLSEFTKSLGGLVPMSIPILPMNTKGIISYNDQTCFIIESPPNTMSMEYMERRDSVERLHHFKLNFPWTYYGVVVNNYPISIINLYLFFAKEPIQSEESELGLLCMPNISVNDYFGQMCLGKVELQDNNNLCDCVTDLISAIRNSSYNSDLFNPNKDTIVKHIWDKRSLTTEGKLDVLLKDDPHNETLLRAKASDYIRTLLTWHLISEKETPQEFAQNIQFLKKFKYSEFLDKIEKEIGNAR